MSYNAVIIKYYAIMAYEMILISMSIIVRFCRQSSEIDHLWGLRLTPKNGLLEKGNRNRVNSHNVVASYLRALLSIKHYARKISAKKSI